MLHVTVTQLRGTKVTLYYISTYIFHLLQTKEYKKRGVFSPVSYKFGLNRATHLLYKSHDVTCNMLQRFCNEN